MKINKKNKNLRLNPTIKIKRGTKIPPPPRPPPAAKDEPMNNKTTPTHTTPGVCGENKGARLHLYINVSGSEMQTNGSPQGFSNVVVTLQYKQDDSLRTV
tara:strand:+ start:746 stop:1045 length:300 start_codon:yes stop_codon:yes gene_type:complete